MEDGKNSLLVTRIGGESCQVLADEESLYIVRLGVSYDPASCHRAIRDLSGFRPGPGMRRIPKEDIRIVHLIRSAAATELCLSTAEEELTWHMDEALPDEAVERFFGGLCTVIEGEDAAGERGEGEELPPVPGGELLRDAVLTALSLLLPVLWWFNQSVLLFWLNLSVFPLAALLLARGSTASSRRLSASHLPWLLPGLALLLMNIRVRLADPVQLILPVCSLAAAVTLFYMALSRKKRKDRVAAILILCLLTYAPGAAIGLNSLSGRVLLETPVMPTLIRRGEMEIAVAGEVRRYAIRPDIARQLTLGESCRLLHLRGALGIEYETIVPMDGGPGML